MKKFINKIFQFSLIIIIPFFILLLSYLYFDPFKVVRQYNDFSYPYVIPNRDYVSTITFVRNYKKYNYNSFIFGNSRTFAFKINSWRNYLSNADKPYMFDASGESIYGIYTKLKYLDSIKVDIKNAIIIFCRDGTFFNSENQKGYLVIKSPITSGESNFDFHYEFFKAYLNPMFLFCFYSYKISGNYRPFMFNYINNRKIIYDTITNEINIVGLEAKINQNPVKYYSERKIDFYERTTEEKDSIQRITQKELFMLQEIKRILEKNNTNYKIVLSPLYEQIKFHSSDFLVLKNQFSDKLYDFSGKNSFTNNKMNYYETSHYRPSVGDSILKIIYR